MLYLFGFETPSGFARVQNSFCLSCSSSLPKNPKSHWPFTKEKAALLLLCPAPHSSNLLITPQHRGEKSSSHDKPRAPVMSHKGHAQLSAILQASFPYSPSCTFTQVTPSARVHRICPLEHTTFF